MPINASYRCSWEWCFKKAVVFFKQFFGTFMGALMWAELRGLLWAAVAPNILPMATVYGVMRCATLHLDCVLAPWGCAALTPGCILAPRGCATLTPGCILAPLQGARGRDDRKPGGAFYVSPSHGYGRVGRLDERGRGHVATYHHRKLNIDIAQKYARGAARSAMVADRAAPIA